MGDDLGTNEVGSYRPTTGLIASSTSCQQTAIIHSSPKSSKKPSNDCSRCPKIDKIFSPSSCSTKIDEDERWVRSTEANADKLRGLIGEVLQADSRGQCEPLDPDRL